MGVRETFRSPSLLLPTFVVQLQGFVMGVLFAMVRTETTSSKVSRCNHFELRRKVITVFTSAQTDRTKGANRTRMWFNWTKRCRCVPKPESRDIYHQLHPNCFSYLVTSVRPFSEYMFWQLLHKSHYMSAVFMVIICNEDYQNFLMTLSLSHPVW